MARSNRQGYSQDSDEPINGFTVHTLHQHISAIIDERDKRYEEKFAAKSELAIATGEAFERAQAALKLYYERLLSERDDRYEARFKAQELATTNALQGAERAQDLARNAIEKRLDTMNEFRQALTDQTQNYLTRVEYAIQHKSLEDILDAHIQTEVQRVQVQEERMDGRMRGMKADIENKSDIREVQMLREKQDSNSKWLFGIIAALFISIIMTVVDLAMRVM